MTKWLYVPLLLLQLCAFAQSSDLHDKYKSILENSTWVVPPSTLLAYQYNMGTTTSTEDQTVWIIDSYNGGYFFGNSYTYLSSESIYSQRIILGTITTEGSVYITFYPTGMATEFSDLVNGIGLFQNIQGIDQFVMQMNSGTTTNGVSHWSYMISVQPGDAYYEDLPGVGTSIPVFLTNF